MLGLSKVIPYMLREGRLKTVRYSWKHKQPIYPMGCSRKGISTWCVVFPKGSIDIMSCSRMGLSTWWLVSGRVSGGYTPPRTLAFQGDPGWRVLKDPSANIKMSFINCFKLLSFTINKTCYENKWVTIKTVPVAERHKKHYEDISF